MTEKVLIGYGTRYGSTAETAEAMAKTVQEMGSQVDLVNLKKETPPSSLQDYDLIVIGSGIQAGRWTKEPLEFIKTNIYALSQSKVAIFVVCAYAASPDKCEMAQIEFLNKIIEENPGLAPIATGLFPGVFDFSKYNFAMRALVKRMLKQEMEPGQEVPEKIDFRNWEMVNDWIIKLVKS
ncbi:MAG: flavodoxin domain-containing protein [Candidatus Thorarchaeota archaeon]|jgi:menaquinone-dependent protoporphyrinogen oxidase